LFLNDKINMRKNKAPAKRAVFYKTRCFRGDVAANVANTFCGQLCEQSQTLHPKSLKTNNNQLAHKNEASWMAPLPD
jgi:hypothetical protein